PAPRAFPHDFVTEEEGRARVEAVVELNPDTVLHLPELSGLRITRLDRPEANGSRLPAALREWTLQEDDYVWGAGEVDLMSELRSYLRECLRMPANQVSMVGYWRRNPQP
ncbi:MAG: SIP domain-containing protein, partial [Chloroflexi bacterium]|nr:SIP domain-containing protein [Chloroflexota bacterium]